MLCCWTNFIALQVLGRAETWESDWLLYAGQVGLAGEWLLRVRMLGQSRATLPCSCPPIQPCGLRGVCLLPTLARLNQGFILGWCPAHNL